jgi:hypothetical protein
MITVTLNFKTIEAARKALLEIPSSALVGGPEPEAEIEYPKIEAPKPAAPPAAASGKATAKGGAAPGKTAAENAPAAESVAAEPPASTAAASSPAPAIEYTVLQKAVFTLAGKSREAAAAVAASFGVKTFKDLPADKWADALAAVNAKLAELESA